MAKTLIRDARIPGQLVIQDYQINGLISFDLLIEDGLVSSIAQTGEQPNTLGWESEIDCRGGMLFPAWVDSHVHLDKSHTWNRAPNPNHTFQDALETLGADKANWTEEEMYARADFTMRCAWAHGVGAIRTHVDTWGAESEISFATLSRLREAWKGKIELQLVSLCGVDQYSEPNGQEFVDIPLKYGATCLGGMPLINPELDKQLDRLLAMASEAGVGIDLHVDESGDPGAACLKAVAEAVLRNQFEYPVTCGHCCSLAVQPWEEAQRTLELVKQAGIRIITLPLCNLYLQDRRLPAESRHTPHWRGITLVQEMLAMGIPVAAASDNVRDAFYAYGDLNPFEVMVQLIRIGHLDTQYSNAAAMVGLAAADIMGLEKHRRIKTGTQADFVLFQARDWSELLSRPSQKPQIIRGGHISNPELPDYRELDSLFS